MQLALDNTAAVWHWLKCIPSFFLASIPIISHNRRTNLKPVNICRFVAGSRVQKLCTRPAVKRVQKGQQLIPVPTQQLLLDGVFRCCGRGRKIRQFIRPVLEYECHSVIFSLVWLLKSSSRLVLDGIPSASWLPRKIGAEHDTSWAKDRTPLSLSPRDPSTLLRS